MKARTLTIVFLTIFLTVPTLGSDTNCDKQVGQIAKSGRFAAVRKKVFNRQNGLIFGSMFLGLIGANYETTIFPWLFPEEFQQADSEEDGLKQLKPEEPALAENESTKDDDGPAVADDKNPLDPSTPQTR